MSSITTRTVDIDSTLSGFYAASEHLRGAVLVFMEAFGITGHIRGVCERLAEQGYAALAPDIFHGKVFAYDDMEHVFPHLKTLDETVIMDEAGRALDWLAKETGMDASRTGTIGFCLGGRLATRTALDFPALLGAAVGCYGGGIAPREDKFGRAPLTPDFVKLQAPLLLVYGAEDGSIAPDEHGRIATALSEQKKDYGISVYANAGHGFLCEQRDSYAPEAAARAWPEILGFFQHNLGRA